MEYSELKSSAGQPPWSMKDVTRDEFERVKFYSMDVALNILSNWRKRSYPGSGMAKRPSKTQLWTVVPVKDVSDDECHFPDVCSPKQWPCDQCWQRTPGTLFCHPGGAIRVEPQTQQATE